jgi:transposase
MRPFQEAVNRWLTVPGIKHRLAWNLVAEVGHTVEVFPSVADLVSWAGVCPGNNPTGGKRRAAPRARVIPGCGEGCVRAHGQLPKARGLICRRSSGA